MGLYVEVMCDEMKEWPKTPPYASKINNRCWSHENANPQGRTVRQARKEAKKQGWTVSGNYACCPACKEKL